MKTLIYKLKNYYKKYSDLILSYHKEIKTISISVTLFLIVYRVSKFISGGILALTFSHLIEVIIYFIGIIFNFMVKLLEVWPNLFSSSAYSAF